MYNVLFTNFPYESFDNSIYISIIICLKELKKSIMTQQKEKYQAISLLEIKIQEGSLKGEFLNNILDNSHTKYYFSVIISIDCFDTVSYIQQLNVFGGIGFSHLMTSYPRDRKKCVIS